VRRPLGCEKEGREKNLISGPHIFNYEKNVITPKPKKTKLNFDCTIKFISINTSKQDVTWIYLDKMISGPHRE
jgi:hypothetical protein